MGQFFADGGYLMVPILLMGFGLTALGTLQATRPQEHRWRAVKWLAVAQLSLGTWGFVAALVATVRNTQDVEDLSLRARILIAGAAESANNLTLALIFLTIGGTLSAVGAFRSKPAA
ncbi:MAG: hypothetical protein U0228_09180 [Myxococcaceae bacterium]